MYQPFQKAKAVWAAGREKTVNLTCVFTAEFSALRAGKLIVTASSLYRAFLNGKLVGYGPARAAHGYFRVDEIDLSASQEKNVLVIEVAGYNCNSFYTLNQPSFLQAEVLDGDRAIAFTGAPCVGFGCRILRERLQKVARFSYQRSFVESYRFGEPFCGFDQMNRFGEAAETAEVGYGVLMPRKINYPEFVFCDYRACENGTASFKDEFEPFPRRRYLTNSDLVIFPEEEWQADACDTAYNLEYRKTGGGSAQTLSAGEYAVYAHEVSLTGFIRTQFRAEEDSLVYVLFDEVDFRTDCKEDEGINVCFWRNDTLNVITYDVKQGEFLHVGFEAYTAKYIKIVVLKGRIGGVKIGLYKYENPDAGKFYFHCEDEKLNAIVSAARETFAQNSVDVLTDCPSRERAGWLCDSYFSGQAEKLFTGGNVVERNFLENYYFQSENLNLGEGVLAMCYPADFIDGLFIPNWMMFYLLELDGYFARTGDRDFIDKVYGKAESILKYFGRFENEFGLLENLESWVFVEWSMANDNEFIKGVNAPTNMLYAKALECFGRLYGKAEYLEKAEKVKREIRRLAFNGTLFEDNLIRKDGRLERLSHTSETCQYYAFYFGIADEETYPDLYRFVFEKLGPKRDGGAYKDIYVSNAFIGNLLRLDYLVSQGRVQQFLDESKEYYFKMAQITGTLWEHNQIHCSLNHGFASYVANMVVKGLSGFRGVDECGRCVYFENADAVIPCKLKIPTRDDYIEVTCAHGERTVKLPEGYRLVECA